MARVTSYAVVGMSCEHCVRAVQEEVGAIDGVEAVAVDLPSGRVDVTAGDDLEDGAVRAAVAEAGYGLAG